MFRFPREGARFPVAVWRIGGGAYPLGKSPLGADEVDRQRYAAMRLRGLGTATARQGRPKNDVMSKQITRDVPSAVRILIVSSALPSFWETDCEAMREPGFFE